MVTVAIRALDLDYLDKILDWGRSRSRYIFTDSDSTTPIATPTPHPGLKCAFLIPSTRLLAYNYFFF
jgi:hypothetical protein